MGNDTPKLTDDQVLEYASHDLDAHLPLVAEGYKCRTEDLLHILLVAAARQCTIESACAELNSGPGAETVRQYRNGQLTPERLPELEASLNETLVSQAPARPGSSMMATVLLKLSDLAVAPRHAEVAHRNLAAVQEFLVKAPLGFGQRLVALDYAPSRPFEIAIVGLPDDKAT
jgi:hypothetical protein